MTLPVLIVGGGPVGLTASFLLSRLGISSLLVERHPGTAIHPKARGINARTMEVFHQQGLAPDIRKAGLAPDKIGFIVWAKSLAGEEIERRVPWGQSAKRTEVTPVRPCLCAQHFLEPVLRRAAEGQPLATLRFNTEMTSFEQTAAGIVATIVDTASGATEKIAAEYMIAADGTQSRVRQSLGIALQGRKDVYDSVNVLIEADLRQWTQHRPAALYFIENEGLRATFLTINAHDSWGFLVNPLKSQGFTPEDFTPERSIELVRKAVGVPDLPVKVMGVAPWIASAQVADRYREGRIFLAGDAAHEMPPTGGFGMNTGVQDVQNLCWKLAAVLQGKAGDALLQSYNDERQPLGKAITEQSLANAVSMGRTEKTITTRGARPEFLNEQGMIFGATYRSSAIVPDGSPPPVVANPVTDYVPSAWPGVRAPHLWLKNEGEDKVSSIDLIGNGFVLFTGRDGANWADAARAQGIEPIAVGTGRFATPEAGWRDLYGIEEAGAVLVRPDGHVGWRSATMAANPDRTLADAMSTIHGRG